MTNPMYETPIEISQVQWSVQSGAVQIPSYDMDVAQSWDMQLI